MNPNDLAYLIGMAAALTVALFLYAMAVVGLWRQR